MSVFGVFLVHFFPDLVQNTDQKNFEYIHFLGSAGHVFYKAYLIWIFREMFHEIAVFSGVFLISVYMESLFWERVGWWNLGNILGESMMWDKVFKSGLSKLCGRQVWNFLKAAFVKIYLVHSWILCLTLFLVFFN